MEKKKKKKKIFLKQKCLREDLKKLTMQIKLLKITIIYIINIYLYNNINSKTTKFNYFQ